MESKRSSSKTTTSKQPAKSVGRRPAIKSAHAAVTEATPGSFLDAVQRAEQQGKKVVNVVAVKHFFREGEDPSGPVNFAVHLHRADEVAYLLLQEQARFSKTFSAAVQDKLRRKGYTFSIEGE
jgi:hypothetical protein